MYRFKTSKSNNRGAIDGFIGGGSSAKPDRRPIVKRDPVEDRSRFINRPGLGRLDDFKKPEGFAGRSTPRMTQNSQYNSSVLSEVKTTNNQRTVNTNIFEEELSSGAGKKKNRFGLRILVRAFIVLIVVGMIGGGYIFGKAWWNAHKVFKGGAQTAIAFNKDVDPKLLNGEGDGRVNILLLGKGGDKHTGGDLTDSMMIASVDPINVSLTLMSIPRDLWVKPDGLWSMKINAVYTSAKNKALELNPNDKEAAENSGLTKSASVVEKYLGIPVHYYGLIEFTAFQEAVDTLGGIDITLAEPYNDYSMRIGSNYLNLPAGTQHVNGSIALAYARSRYGSARGDFDRGGHQQVVLVGIKDKVLSLGTFANPIKVSQLLDTFGNRVRTNLSLDDLMRIYGITKNLKNSEISSIDLANDKDGVLKTGPVGNQSVVMPKAGVNDFSKVKEFVRKYLKDGFIIKEDPTIIVLNGTDKKGLAQQRADELIGYGYNVIQVGDAPTKGVTMTQLVDKTKGVKKYTRTYLEKRLLTTAVKSIDGLDLSEYSADFIIVVGPQG